MSTIHTREARTSFILPTGGGIRGCMFGALLPYPAGFAAASSFGNTSIEIKTAPWPRFQVQSMPSSKTQHR